jgi:Ankyrin repeats (3 copies)
MVKKADSVNNTDNYASNYIYKCIKGLDDDDKLNSKHAYNKLMIYIKKHPESLYLQIGIYTPYIYAASINLNTLIQFHNIYKTISYKGIDLPDVYVEPYEFKNTNGDTLLHYITNRIIKDKQDKTEDKPGTQDKQDKPDKPDIKNMYVILEYIINTINVNKNAIDKNGNTVLHLASKYNKIDLVKFLLFHGINPNIINNEKKIALNYAVINNNIDIFKILLYKNSNYKYIKNEPNYEVFIDIIDRYKKKVYRKIVNTTKKKQSIKRSKQLQSRHLFLCKEIYNKLDAINNDNDLKKYKSELYNMAEQLNIDISTLNLNESKIEIELNKYKNLCTLISNKIVMKKSLK